MPLARSRRRPWAATPAHGHRREQLPSRVRQPGRRREDHRRRPPPPTRPGDPPRARHARLDREIALAPQLPAGLTAPLPGSGLCRLGTRDGSADCTAGYPPATPDRRWENLLTTAGSSARLRSWPRLRTSRPWTGTESWPALCSTA